MVLSELQIKDLITNNDKRSVILKAIAHENRLRFHCQKQLRDDYQLTARDFFAFVKNLLPHDKYLIFKELFRYPVMTNGVTEIIFNKLSRIFNGQNPAFNYQFMSSELRDDWEYYRQIELHEPSVWETVAFEYFKTEINSILVVDLPQKQLSERPEPYFYFLSIKDVITYNANKDGLMDYIIFNQKNDKIAVVDSASYRIYENKSGNIGTLIYESKHDLGYTPAKFFWNKAVKVQEPDVKESPITKELASLDWLLFYHISKQQLDLFGSYPIYSGYEQNCDYSNDENGDYCDGGYLRNKSGHYILDNNGGLYKCPKCGNKRIVGAGSFVEIPIPDGDKQPDLRNPIQMLTVDKDSLEYNVSEEKRLTENIIKNVVGFSDNVVNKEAVNETQVNADFEDATTVLIELKKGFEAAQKFVDETICRLRYGSDFIAAQINFGTTFYLLNATQLRERYSKAKNSGASESELDALQKQIISSEYKNDQTQMQRMLTLFEIEPYRHLTRAETISLYDKNLISREDLMLKLDFVGLIDRFERENINVTEFGSAMDFAKKIDKIKETLKLYVAESLPKEQTQQPTIINN